MDLKETGWGTWPGSSGQGRRGAGFCGDPDDFYITEILCGTHTFIMYNLK